MKPAAAPLGQGPAPVRPRRNLDKTRFFPVIAMSIFAPRHSSWPGRRSAMTPTLFRSFRPSSAACPRSLLLAAVRCCSAGLSPGARRVPLAQPVVGARVRHQGRPRDRPAVDGHLLADAGGVHPHAGGVHRISSSSTATARASRRCTATATTSWKSSGRPSRRRSSSCWRCTSDKLWLQLRAAAPKEALTHRHRGLPVRVPRPQPRQGRQARLVRSRSG